MTDTGITLTQFRQMMAEDRARAEAELAAKQAAKTAGGRETALELLAEELGSREAALEQLALNPDQHLARLAPAIAERQEKNAAEEKAREEARAAADFAASPEGRAEAALAAAKKADDRKALAAAARQLLVDEGIETAERAADIPDDDVLAYTGIEPSAQQLAHEAEMKLLSDPEAMAAHEATEAKKRLYEPAAWHQMSPEVRADLAATAGLDVADVDQWHKDDLTRRFG